MPVKVGAQWWDKCSHTERRVHGSTHRRSPIKRRPMECWLIDSIQSRQSKRMANDVRGKFVCGKSSSAKNKSDNIKYLVTFWTVDYRWAECCVYNRRLMGASNGSVCVCVCVLCWCREWFGAAFKIDTQKAGAEGIDQRDIIQWLTSHPPCLFGLSVCSVCSVCLSHCWELSEYNRCRRAPLEFLEVICQAKKLCWAYWKIFVLHYSSCLL